MNRDIVGLIRERGVLLQRELFDFLADLPDVELARRFLELLERASGQKMITSSSLMGREEQVTRALDALPDNLKLVAQTLLISIGLRFSMAAAASVLAPVVRPIVIPEQKGLPYSIFYANTSTDKKIEVGDFVSHFRSRYQELQRILMQRPDVQNLVSISKISRDRTRFTLVGIVSEKRITPNKNLILTVEDLTGKQTLLVKHDSECMPTAAELQLDDIVAFVVSGNREIAFVHSIIFPDAFKEKVWFEQDMCVAFVSDVHVGSKKHLGAEFERFLEWINSSDPLAQKIQYIFFVGDNVDGVGVFPGQERLLDITQLGAQYEKLASYLQRIPSRITMFMCPGQHDSVRVAEPQPVIETYYGAPLHAIPNLTLVSNPSLIKLFEGDKTFKVLMYHGASIHSFINEIQELRLMKAHRCPAKAVRHMLKRRHLAPSHGEVAYIPNAQHDPLVISEVPDVLCTGEVHRLDIETYNGTLIITGSCWQAQTEFEEKVGNVPDPCKVPVFNLKTRELKILDFTSSQEEVA